MKNIRKGTQQGFTLVELLIVVIILALLAAIVVPQFASSTDDAKLASLDTSLANIRSAVDLYYQQHGEYPGINTAVDATCTATDGTGTGVTGVQAEQAFLDQLSLYTNANGGTCSVKDAVFEFGPYLKKNTLPSNPITNVSTLEIATTGDILMAGTNVDLGWKFDIVAGKFIANDTTDPDGAGAEVSYDQR
jgi:type II secretion system protein G